MCRCLFEIVTLVRRFEQDEVSRWTLSFRWIRLLEQCASGFCFVRRGWTALLCWGLLVFEVSRRDAVRYTTLGMNPLDDRSARHRGLYLSTYNIHYRQTSMSPARFEPKLPASEWPQGSVNSLLDENVMAFASLS
jgi:hypothetical protein